MKLSSLIKNKVFGNAAWIIGCKLVQAVLNLVITMLTARFFGASTFGVINYADSVVSFLAPVMELGLAGILVHELIEHPEEEGRILGTSVMMSVVSSFFCIGGVVAFASVANAGEPVTIAVCALYSISLLFRAIELFRYWFQAKYLSRDFAVVSLIAYVLVSSYKIVLLALRLDVRFFAMAFALDYALIDLLLLILYKKRGGMRVAFSWRIARRMLKQSKYYILSELMVVIFAQTDKIMLKLMVGDAECGFYSAAATCAAMTGFVFQAIVDAFRPYIFESLKRSRELFELSVKRLYSVLIYACLLESVALAALARVAILILYGDGYLASVPILRVSVWYMTFSFLGVVRNIWLLAEGKQKYQWTINLCGAIANVVLNALLIPHLGGVGAALASLSTQMFTNVIVGFILPPIRPNNRLMLSALHPKYLLGILRIGKEEPTDAP